MRSREHEHVRAGAPKGGSLVGVCMLLAAASVAAAADAPPLVLTHLTTAEGLPQGSVHTVLQDSQGFMWFGTEDGLVRYDGQELVRYGYSPRERRGLPGNFIRQIVEGPRHNLWLAIKWRPRPLESRAKTLHGLSPRPT